MNRSTPGQRIASLRGSRSQAAFADEMGVHKNTLGGYERDARAPDGEFLAKLAARGVNINWVLTGGGDTYVSSGAQLGESPGSYATETAAAVPTLDRQLLRRVVQDAEAILSETEREASVDEYAELIALLYELHSEGGGKLDSAKVIELARFRRRNG